jgi:PAS domain S-box-containing protein
VSEAPRSTARSAPRALGLAIHLQAIALVAAVFTIFFVGVAREQPAATTAFVLAAVATGGVALAAAIALILLALRGPGAAPLAALLIGTAILANAVVQAHATPFAPGALTVSLMLAVATVLPYVGTTQLWLFLLASFACAIAVPVLAARSPYRQLLPPSLEVLVSVTATACAAGLVLLLLAQFRARMRQLLEAQAESRERAEHAAALLDVLFEKAPVGLAVVDPQLRYLRVNQRLAEIQGQPAEAHVGRTVAEASPVLAPALARGFQAALDGQIPHVDELVGDSPAAPGPRDLLVSYYPIRVGQDVVAAGGMVLDVTDHKQAERELEEAIRVRDDFISVASHELKTPLTSLRLNLDGLLSAARGTGTLTPEKLHRRLEVVDRVADRLQHMIEELLNITRVTSGHLALTLTQVDVAEVIDDVLARLANQLADAHCTVNANLQRPVQGRWDKLRLDQVVTNLVSNAIKYGGGQPIDISLTANDQGAVLVVRDRGIGIAAEDHSRIFRRFERAVSTRSFGGLGIGLWLVERIVGALGGQISVASQPGQGAVFSVMLPREGPAVSLSPGPP